MDENFVQQMRRKLEAELAAKEQEVLGYWLAELRKEAERRHQDLASQSAALKNLIKRMETRLKNI